MYPEDLVIPKQSFANKIKFNVACQKDMKREVIPHGYWLMPRSSISKTPLRMANSLGLIDYEKLKRYMIKYLLKGRDFEDISFYAKKYYDEKIMSDIKNSALVSLNKHKNSGDTIVIVSASLEIVLQHFCYQYGFDLIANILIFKNGICVGEIEGKDCNGEEKVNRVRNKYNLKKHKHIYAYGDSEFDLPMLKIADYPNYRKFS